LKSHKNKGELVLLRGTEDRADTVQLPVMDASVLAKLAEDVIAWNRPLTQNEVQEGARPAQVASLSGLSRGFKIRRTEETFDESSMGVVRLIHKDK
jgi:hypothetical protein